MIKATSNVKTNRLFIRATREQLITEGIIREGFFQTGGQLKAHANEKILKGLKTGRLYRIRRGKIIKNHRSSAPGETHANLSGTLRRSIGWKVSGHYLTFGYGVPRGKNSQAPIYARRIEFGDKEKKPGRGFIAPRPTLRNAIRANIGRTQNNFAEAFKKRNNL